MFRICRFGAWVRACKLVGCREVVANCWSNSFCGMLSNGLFPLAARDCGCQGSIAWFKVYSFAVSNVRSHGGNWVYRTTHSFTKSGKILGKDVL